MGQMDTRLCAGLETLVAKVPALKETTPALYATTEEAAVSYATLITTYMATFTLLGALADVLGLTCLLAFLGLRAVGTTAEVKVPVKKESVEK